MITMRPRSAGIEPSTSNPATMSPHNAIGPGFAATARNEVVTAVPTPTSRSSKSGNDTTLIDSTIKREQKTDPDPDADHCPAPRRREHVAHKAADRGRRLRPQRP